MSGIWVGEGVDPSQAAPGHTPVGAPAAAQPQQQPAPAQAQPAPQQQPQQSAPQMPAGGQAKYWNAETGAYNWEAHARELAFNEQRRAQPQQQPQAQPQVPEQPSQAQLDWTQMVQTVAETGAVPEAHRAALKAMGMPDELIDMQAAALRAYPEYARHQAASYAGGEEQLSGLLTWAAQNLQADEIQQYNAVLAGKDWQLAIDALKARQAGASPTRNEPRLIQPQGQPRGGNVGFGNQTEMLAAMQDPRYGKDPHYTNEVRQRVAVTPDTLLFGQ